MDESSGFSLGKVYLNRRDLSSLGDHKRPISGIVVGLPGAGRAFGSISVLCQGNVPEGTLNQQSRRLAVFARECRRRVNDPAGLS